MNHFELFDIPAQYELDTSELQRRYRQLQQTLHPDRFANAGERDKLRAVQKTSQLNDAYQTLKKPLTRAEYILTLRGVDIRHEQQTIRDPEFLMAQMEWRERFEEVESSADVLGDVTSARHDLSAEIVELEALLLQQLSDEADAAAADSVRKLKFMFKLQFELDAIEERQFD